MYPTSPLECNVSQGGRTHSPDSLDIRPITCTLKFLLTTTSSHWFLLRVHKADSDSTSTTTSLTHFTTRSSPTLRTTSTSSLVHSPLRYHTLLSDYVKATHTTASSTGNSTQVSNGNHVSLYTGPPTSLCMWHSG